jgi:hypothetical protein
LYHPILGGFPFQSLPRNTGFAIRQAHRSAWSVFR